MATSLPAAALAALAARVAPRHARTGIFQAVSQEAGISQQCACCTGQAAVGVYGIARSPGPRLQARHHPHRPDQLQLVATALESLEQHCCVSGCNVTQQHVPGERRPRCATCNMCHRLPKKAWPTPRRLPAGSPHLRTSTHSACMRSHPAALRVRALCQRDGAACSAAAARSGTA